MYEQAKALTTELAETILAGELVDSETMVLLRIIAVQVRDLKMAEISEPVACPICGARHHRVRGEGHVNQYDRATDEDLGLPLLTASVTD